MGGLSFMADGAMFCSVSGRGGLLVRVGAGSAGARAGRAACAAGRHGQADGDGLCVRVRAGGLSNRRGTQKVGSSAASPLPPRTRPQRVRSKSARRRSARRRQGKSAKRRVAQTPVARIEHQRNPRPAFKLARCSRISLRSSGLRTATPWLLRGTWYRKSVQPVQHAVQAPASRRCL